MEQGSQGQMGPCPMSGPSAPAERTWSSCGQAARKKQAQGRAWGQLGLSDRDREGYQETERDREVKIREARPGTERDRNRDEGTKREP